MQAVNCEVCGSPPVMVEIDDQRGYTLIACGNDISRTKCPRSQRDLTIKGRSTIDAILTWNVFNDPNLLTGVLK